MTATQIRSTIAGVPYLFTRNAHGWRVTALESRTDRLHRSYQVYTTESGTPLKCSCAHCAKAGAWCKHLREAERIQREEGF